MSLLSLPTNLADAYQVVRYDAKGAVVFGMGLPPESHSTLSYDNPFALGAFMEGAARVEARRRASPQLCKASKRP